MGFGDGKFGWGEDWGGGGGGREVEVEDDG